jgi:hypothetical protein
MVESLVMETSAPTPFPQMPTDYYRRDAEHVSRAAATPAVRDPLADVAIQYEHLAEEAEAGYRALR